MKKILASVFCFCFLAIIFGMDSNAETEKSNPESTQKWNEFMASGESGLVLWQQVEAPMIVEKFEGMGIDASGFSEVKLSTKPVAGNELNFWQTAAWGAEFLYAPTTAKDKAVVSQIKYSELSPEELFDALRIVDAVDEYSADDAPLFAFGIVEHGHPLLIPVKWNEDFASTVRTLKSLPNREEAYDFIGLIGAELVTHSTIDRGTQEGKLIGIDDLYVFTDANLKGWQSGDFSVQKAVISGADWPTDFK
ncbi:MAG: hypothetical protein AAF530_22590 [Pseudomonadota bacterium]